MLKGNAALNDNIINEFILNPNYVISETGEVYTYLSVNGASITSELRLKYTSTDELGYKHLKYKNKSLCIHRIVYAKFIGSLDQNLTINHKDGNPSNNHKDNLELVTQSENNKHAYKIGKKPVYGNTVLNFTIANEIREKKKLGYTHKQLCEEYGISKGHVSEIVNNKIWI